MRNTVKTILSLMLCMALVFSALTACGQTGEQASAANNGANSETAIDDKTYGRYVEEDITPEGMTGSISNFTSFGNGVLDITTGSYVGNAPQERWRSEDNGETWSQLDMGWMSRYHTPIGEETSGYFDVVGRPMPNGELVASISWYASFSADGEPKSDIPIDAKIVFIDGHGVETPLVADFLQEAENNGKHCEISLIYLLSEHKLMCMYVEYDFKDLNIDFLGKDSKCVVIDIKTGETLYEIDLENMLPSSVYLYQLKNNEETLYVTDSNSGLSTISIETGEPCEVPLPSKAIQQSLNNSDGIGYYYEVQNPTLVYINNAGEFYTANREGLRKHEQMPQNATSAPTGGVATQGELIMNGVNYTFGSPLYDIQMLQVNEETNDIFVSLNASGNPGSPGEGKLLRYVWDDNAIATSSDKLSVFSLYDSAAVRLALSEFKRLRVDVAIEYNTAFGRKPGSQEAQTSESVSVAYGITPQMEEEAIRTLNTQLLAGEGPDVIFLDDMPIDSFIRNGVLADITDFANNDSNIMPSLISPMLVDGKAYALPTSFSIPVMFGGSTDVPVPSLDAYAGAVSAGANLPVALQLAPNASLEEHQEYMRQTTGPRDITMQPFINAPSLKNLFNALYPSSAAAIFPQQSGVDANALESFLQAIKTISDKYELIGQSGEESHPQLSISPSAIAFAERRARTGYDMLTTTLQLNEITSLLYWSGEPVPAYDGTMQEPDVAIEDLQVAYGPMPGLSSGVYLPTQVVGVTSTAKQPEVAMQFLSTLFSDALQNNNMGAGLPVTKSSFNSALIAYDASVQENSDFFDNPRIVPTTDVLLEMISALSTPYYANSHLYNSVFSVTQQYCEGAIAPDAAIAQVENDTQLYFAERQ